MVGYGRKKTMDTCWMKSMKTMLLCQGQYHSVLWGTSVFNVLLLYFLRLNGSLHLCPKIKGNKEFSWICSGVGTFLFCGVLGTEILSTLRPADGSLGEESRTHWKQPAAQSQGEQGARILRETVPRDPQTARATGAHAEVRSQDFFFFFSAAVEVFKSFFK